MKRTPIEPSPKFAKQLTASLKSGDTLVVDGVTIESPTESKPYWRVKIRVDRQTKEMLGGKTLASVNAAYIEQRKRLVSNQSGNLGKPEEADSQLSEVIRGYIDQGGPEFKWKKKTQDDREDDFRYLISSSKKKKLKCGELNAKHLRECLRESTGSAKRAKHIKGVWATFMIWGMQSGYFNATQADFIKGITWNPPADAEYRVAPTRRKQSQMYFGTDESQGGEIPTHEQVVHMADGLQKRYKYGAGLIHTSANMGTRANETFIFTASRDVFRKGLGNYVDLEGGVVLVHWQQSEKPTEIAATTKNDKRRAVVIPDVSIISTGFDLRAWLTIRSQEALIEQEEGKNPLALIFPNKFFNPIRLNSFNQTAIRPVSDHLGWKMPGWKDARGINRHMYRFSLHAMRDRYGTTAADEWGYSERELLEQGSWSDPATVRKYYLGTSDATFQSVKTRHAELVSGKRTFEKGM